LLRFSEMGIQKFNNYDLNIVAQPVGNSVVVVVTGFKVPVTFSGGCLQPMRFSEMFVLQGCGYNYVVGNYMLSLIN
jgi:hypothetical protein